MKRNRIVIGALLGLFLVASMPQVSFAQEEIGGQKFYVEGTRWTELRLDTTKYDSWFTGNANGTSTPNYEKVEYYVKGDTFAAKYDRTFKKIWRHRDGQPDALIYLFREQISEKWKGEFEICSCYRSGYYSPDFLVGACPTYFSNWKLGNYVSTNGLPACKFTGGGPSKPIGTIEEIKQGTFGTDVPLTYVVLSGGMEGGRHIVIPGLGITSWKSRVCITGPCMAWAEELQDTWDRQDKYHSILVHFERGGETIYDLWPTPEGGLASHVQGVKAGSSPDGQAVYDLQGRKVEGKPSRGIYVIGGKKRVVR